MSGVKLAIRHQIFLTELIKLSISYVDKVSKMPDRKKKKISKKPKKKKKKKKKKSLK